MIKTMATMEAILLAFFQRGSVDTHQPMNQAGLHKCTSKYQIDRGWTYEKQKPTMKQIMPKSSEIGACCTGTMMT
jgi:hypothetical protein